MIAQVFIFYPSTPHKKFYRRIGYGERMPDRVFGFRYATLKLFKIDLLFYTWDSLPTN